MTSNAETAKTDVKNELAQETTKTRKMMNIGVKFLDDSTFTFQMPSKALGRTLFDKVCKMLNLLEADYFGLEYEDETHTKYWLDGLKPLCRQVGLTTISPTFHFCVKFYTPDPVQLEDEFTRYLFSLQLKKDLARGSLQCNDNTAAVMISYIVQADIGDYDAAEFPDHSYLSRYKLIPYQDADLEKKIMESHKKHIGQTPAEAELNLLETARRCELYGIKMTAAKDHEGVPLNLAVAHLGVLVFQNYTKINTFSWAKIRKLSFKRKKFLIKLHPEGYGYYKDTVEFYFEGRNECKNFWKKCIENHTFFRCTDATKGMRQKPKLFSRGSSFRYSGRTQVQLSEYVRENYVKRNFQRSTSLRTTPNSPSKPSDGSISPQPLLPVSTSFSCESVVISDTAPISTPPKKLSASEPSTPHVAQDVSTVMANGNVVNQDSEKYGTSAGLITPDSEQGGYQTPDYMGQETDDNISHDSYHVIDKELPETLNLESKTNGSLQPVQLSPETDHINGVQEVVEISKKKSPEFISYRSLILENRNSLPAAHVETTASVVSESILRSKWGNSKPDSDNADELKELANGSNSTGVNGHGSLYSEQSEDSDSNYLEDTSRSCTETLQALGIPSFRSDSFTSLAEPHLHSYKKVPADKTYFLAKELLMTERTYRRDLEIIDVVFREEFLKQKDIPNEPVEAVLSAVGPLYEIHCSLLRDLEQRMAFWEGKHVKVVKNGIKGVGDILVNHKKMTKLYETYVEQLPEVLRKLNLTLKNSGCFANFYHQFESQKVCYLPLTSFLLRPLYRISQYCDILKALTEQYGRFHVDFSDSQEVLNEFQFSFSKFENKIPPLINCVKLMELERNLVGFPTEPKSEGRVFVREGSLQKLSKNESHQCMIFLFSDILLCTEQIVMGKFRFKVHSNLSISNLKVAKIEPRHGASYCFTVQRGEKCLFLAASSEKERSKWLQDITVIINLASEKYTKSSLSSNSSVEGTVDAAAKCGNGLSEDKPISHHINTSVHVCWHRNISVGKDDLHTAVKYSMSGFLLRKFKNNSVWQKLWVVLANLCLFFYKSYLDDSPLASLPLTGYRVLTPSVDDSITKDCVFKLQYKNYDYFFRAESKFFLDRWMEVIHYCTLADDEKTHL